MAARLLAPTERLRSGYRMPVLGFGTYGLKGEECEHIIKYAIDVGYRHIDTSYFYQNEIEIGNAVRHKIEEGVVKRKDIFVVTKLWNIHHEREHIERICRKQLEMLGLKYIDLYLIHAPISYKYYDDDTLLPKDDEGRIELINVDYLDTYKAMENLVRLGLVRSLGVSNFSKEQLKRILDNCNVYPVTNQIECTPALNDHQRRLIEFCQENNVIVTAYSPLGRPRPQEKKPYFFYSMQTKTLADKYGKTPAQIILRYLIDIGTVPLVKSSNLERIKENFDVFDFHLSQEDMNVMSSFHRVL